LAEARAALREARRRTVTAGRPEVSEAEATIAEAAQAIQTAKQRRPVVRRVLAAPSIPAEAARAGDRVTIRGMPQVGEALGAPDERGEVEVQLGALRLRVRLDQIDRIERNAPRVLAPVAATLPPRGPSPGLELDMRGRRAEETIQNVEEYVNDAFLAGLPFVRIIHGKGTGALRRVVRETLTQNPLVASVETAEANAGGEGVTIARLAV
jgi:DNA mismatch repair protein MutS2